MTAKTTQKRGKSQVSLTRQKIEEKLDSSQGTLRDGHSAITHLSKPPTATKPTNVFQHQHHVFLLTNTNYQVHQHTNTTHNTNLQMKMQKGVWLKNWLYTQTQTILEGNLFMYGHRPYSYRTMLMFL